jgi:hypothetical protein
MLNWMIEKGFRDYEVIPDPTSHKNYNWFVFERTPEFDKAVEMYDKIISVTTSDKKKADAEANKKIVLDASYGQ